MNPEWHACGRKPENHSFPFLYKMFIVIFFIFFNLKNITIACHHILKVIFANVKFKHNSQCELKHA